ncbi:MAG: hypothetical protein MOIL_01635 [Candidatus Methanolliviera sp. GoM_oil]|nr:MAG: hypothetical protein MOIL_01635 [Candidatus Methanolliviera sp. GoM_oil]
MVKAIPHKHCYVCGKVIEPDETFCSEECRQKYESSRRKQWIPFAIFMALMVILLIYSSLAPR